VLKVAEEDLTDYVDDVSTTYIDPNDFYSYFGAGSYTAQVAEAMSTSDEVIADLHTVLVTSAEPLQITMPTFCNTQTWNSLRR
jgi:hypothetical protein